MSLPSFLKPPERNQFLSVLLGNFISFFYQKKSYSEILVNTITFTHGITYSWLSPTLLLLKSSDTPLESGPLEIEQVSFLSSLLTFGGIFGIILSQMVQGKFGNRVMLICTAIPHIIWWFFVAFSDQYWHLVVARFISGLAGGSAHKLIPCYVSEVAQKE